MDKVILNYFRIYMTISKKIFKLYKMVLKRTDNSINYFFIIEPRINIMKDQVFV